ncbi:hypothetical protein PybrP1_007752 [[Pythium] brassicae (nom. inval.)]|nr:hypothetical protein PybrP1_007752 [[Pythium] brassicae (nom. inval.)]
MATSSPEKAGDGDGDGGASDGSAYRALTRVRAKEFQLSWGAKYGVQVSARDPASGEVVVARCLFCVCFGRDPAPDESARKRRRTANVQHFKQPWRGDNIVTHMRKQHARHFAVYRSLPLAEKASYFGAVAEADAAFDVKADNDEAATDAWGDEGDGEGAEQSAGLQTDAAVEGAALGMRRLVGTSAGLSESPQPQRRCHASHQEEAVVAPATTSGTTNSSFRQLVDNNVARFVCGELLAPSLEPAARSLRRAEELATGFEWQHEDDETSGSRGVDRDGGRFIVRVADPHQLSFAVSFLTAGFAPEQCEELLRLASGGGAHALAGAIAAPNESRVLVHTRHVCAMNYQAIAELLRSAWAFSLVVDIGLAVAGADPARVVDVRVRFAVGGRMHDVHLVALSDSHARQDADTMFRRLALAADAVCADWRKKLVGIANDGAVAMSESLASVVAALQQQHAEFPGCYAVWSGARHVAAVVQRAFESLGDDAFMSKTLQLVGYVRRRTHWVADGAPACPTFAGSQWTSLRESVAWLVMNSAAVRQHFAEAGTREYAPEDAWWIALYALHALVREASACLLTMEGLRTHGAEQNRAIEKLLITLVASGYVDGPGRFQEDPATGVVSGEYRVTFESAEMFVRQQEPFVAALLERVQRAQPAQHATLLRRVARMLADAVCSLAKVRSERARVAGLSDLLPPVRPQDLVRTTAFDLSRLVALQRDRLALSFSEQEAKRIATEFSELLAAYGREAALQSALDTLPSNAGFSASWERVGDRFPSLCRFAGGIASVFSDPSAVGGGGASSGFVKRQYFSGACSAAHIVSWTLHALALPRVATTYQVLSVLEGVTVNPATQVQEHLSIVQTTLSARIQRLLQENARASQFKTYEIDDDRDGIVDSIHLDVTTPLSPNERIHQVTVVVALNYSLQVGELLIDGHIKMNTDAMAMHSYSSALAGESLYVDGTLYYSILVLVSTLTSILVEFVIKTKVVDAFSVLDDPSVVLAKKAK